MPMNPTAVRETLQTLFESGSVFKVRILDAGPNGTVSGYFNDPDKVISEVAKWDGKPDIAAIYVTLNQLPPELLARAKNRLKARAKTTTSDREVARRRWLLIDADPERPAGIPSSADEHTASLQWIERMVKELVAEGWPEPILADSGNGGHALFPIDLPNDDLTNQRLKKLLSRLARRFNDPPDTIPCIKLDTSVYNASRITKLYGTMTGKGDEIENRPHRRSRLLTVTEEVAL